VGGHIEDRESPVDAMVREFEEETGVIMPSWDKFGTLIGDGYKVHLFKSFGDQVFKYKSITDEQVEIFNPEKLPYNCIMNINWLVPMAQFMFGDTAEIIVK